MRKTKLGQWVEGASREEGGRAMQEAGRQLLLLHVSPGAGDVRWLEL